MLSRLNLMTAGRTDKVIYRAGLIVFLIISEPPIKFRNVVGTEMDKGRIHSQDLNNLNNNNRIPSYRCAGWNLGSENKTYYYYRPEKT